VAKQSRDPNAGRSRRAVRRAAVVAGCLLAGFATLLAILFVAIDTQAVARRAKDYLLPRVSERLGREVSVETVRAKLLPNPRVALGGVVIHGRPGEPPLVEAEALDVDLAFWPLLRSFGREIRIQRVKLVRPEVNALRDRRQWNFEGVGQEEKQQEEGQREVSIAHIGIEHGTLRIIDRSGPHGEATVALTDIHLDIENVARGQPLRVRGGAAFASDRRNVQLELKLSSLPASIDELGPGTWPELTGKLRVAGAELTRLEGLLPAKLAGIIRGGLVRLDADVTTAEGRYVLDGAATLDALRVRGEPANGSLHLSARVDPVSPSSSRAVIDHLALRGPGVDLSGSATFVASPVQFEFALRGPLLDLQSILGVTPEANREDATGSRTAVLPARLRRAIDGVSVHGSLEVDRVISGKLEATQLSATALLERGVLRLEKAEAQVYGGQVEASGTTVNLLEPLPRWNLKARISGVDAATAMSALGGSSPLQGKVEAALDLGGRGSAWEQVRNSMTGTAVLALKEGVLTTTDLGHAVAFAAASSLGRLGQSEAAEIAQRAAGPTYLRDLTASFTVHDGWLDLREPLTFTSGVGAGRLDGRVGLDQSLALRGTVVASEEFLASALARTGFRPSAPVEVPVSIAGSLDSPVVEVDERAVARQFASAEARQAARKVEDAVKRQARRRIGDFIQRLPEGVRP
jgi:AsmA protein